VATIHTGSLKLKLRKFEKKTLPGLMSLDFGCDIQMSGSELGVNNIK